MSSSATLALVLVSLAPFALVPVPFAPPAGMPASSPCAAAAASAPPARLAGQAAAQTPKPTKQHPAEELAKLKPPATWLVRSDATGRADDRIYFVDMPPGWHITTGPGATLHDPAVRAEGSFRVESTIFLFPARDGAAEESGYGVLIGGRDLDTAARRYTAVLLRRDGQFAVIAQRGDTRTPIVPWSANPAIVPHAGAKASADPVKNLLAIETSPTELIVTANGQELTRIPRGDLDLDGRIGLRVDSDVNLHVATLSASARAARAARPSAVAAPGSRRQAPGKAGAALALRASGPGALEAGSLRTR